MCPCDKITGRVCEHDAQRIRDLYATRESARNQRLAVEAHVCTELLLDFPPWQVLAVTGEYASSAPADRERQGLGA